MTRDDVFTNDLLKDMEIYKTAIRNMDQEFQDYYYRVVNVMEAATRKMQDEMVELGGESWSERIMCYHDLHIYLGTLLGDAMFCLAQEEMTHHEGPLS